MKNCKKWGSFVVFVLIFSVVFGSFNSSILAYEKSGVNLEQVKTLSSANGTVLNNLNSISSKNKSLFSSSFSNSKEKNGFEKSQQMEVEKKDYVEGEILVKYKDTKINLDKTK